MKATAAMVLAIAMLYGSIQAQVQRKQSTSEAGITFEPVRLTLGTSKNRVLAVLGEHYMASPSKAAGDSDRWDIAAKEVSPKLGGRKLYGWVLFRDAKLVSAWKLWQDTESTDVSLARTLLGMVAVLNAEGFQNCKVTTYREPSSEFDRDAVAMNCGPKGIVIDIQQPRRERAYAIVMVWEVLQ